MSPSHIQNQPHDEHTLRDEVNETTSLLRSPVHNGSGKAGPTQDTITHAPEASSSSSSHRTMNPVPAASTTSPPNSDSPPPNPTLWSRLRTSYIASLILENKGSVARDHLAVERTFLAYIRTSLTFASLGIGITQLYRLNLPVRGTQTTPSTPSTSAASAAQASANAAASAAPYYDAVDPITKTVARSATALGLVFLGIAILILLSAWRRYFEVQRYVIRNQFPASRGLILGVVFFTAAIIFGCAGVVIAVGVGS